MDRSLVEQIMEQVSEMSCLPCKVKMVVNGIIPKKYNPPTVSIYCPKCGTEKSTEIYSDIEWPGCA